jgi:hypothetical protein
MIGYLKLAMHFLVSRFKSRARLEVENIVLRQQLNVLRRMVRSRTRVGTFDRLILVWLYRLFPSVAAAIEWAWCSSYSRSYSIRYCRTSLES